VRVLDAALEVLGTGGIHALSHARVDATAGLPALIHAITTRRSPS
jgi:DNA-binding transcriptional regulator YbjK